MSETVLISSDHTDVCNKIKESTVKSILIILMYKSHVAIGFMQTNVLIPRHSESCTLKSHPICSV